MARTRVLVVEDSLTVRRHLVAVLSADPSLQVVGEAGNGSEAIALCEQLRPDVVTMDMVLPDVDGLTATEHIMAHCPTPILVVSSSTNRGEIMGTCEALAAGAVDVMEKPRGDEAAGAWEHTFLTTLRLVSRIKVITHPRARLHDYGKVHERVGGPALPRPSQPAQRYALAALGASTGGPGAILEVLRGLSLPFPLPVLFVLHIGEPFAAAFAEWLNQQVEMRVSYGRHGELVEARAGEVVMAPAGSHLIVKGGRLQLTRAEPRHHCRPSVDVLFESVAREYGAAAIGGLLTGMGRDGAEGLLQIRRAGGATLGQDEATSVVYGMPREAQLIGAVERVLPLGAIGPAISALAGQGSA